MISERARQFYSQANLQFTSYCHRFATRIVGFVDGAESEHRGTGVLCRLGNHCTVVTALHTLTKIRKSATFKSFGVSSFTDAWKLQEIDFDDIDVSVLVLETEPRVVNDKQFWVVDTDRADRPSVLDQVIVHGFPASQSRFSAFLPGYVSEGHTESTWVRPRQSDAENNPGIQQLAAEFEFIRPVPDNLMRNGQYAVNYKHGTGPLIDTQGEVITDEGILADNSTLYEDGIGYEGQRQFGPGGLSGSPVWDLKGRQHCWDLSEWTIEKPTLSGIVTDWNQGQEALLVTPMAEILRRLEDHGIT